MRLISYTFVAIFVTCKYIHVYRVLLTVFPHTGKSRNKPPKPTLSRLSTTQPGIIETCIIYINDIPLAVGVLIIHVHVYWQAPSLNI